ncbi:MAG: hypothetical protein NUV98_02235 [Candidatus Roizmanbacteria bacterium]|nr:hypothetical protein [Candidatus Roizmanbacteria bacterium]
MLDRNPASAGFFVKMEQLTFHNQEWNERISTGELTNFGILDDQLVKAWLSIQLKEMLLDLSKFEDTDPAFEIDEKRDDIALLLSIGKVRNDYETTLETQQGSQTLLRWHAFCEEYGI